MKMKKLSVLLLALLLASTVLVGCGGEKEPEDTSYKPEPTSGMVGNYTITPTWLPFDSPFVLTEITDNKNEVGAGGEIYILDSTKLYQYQLNGSALTKANELDLENEAESLSIDNNGVLWTGYGPSYPIDGIKDMQKATATTIKMDIEMAPDGTWGLGYWVNKPVELVKNDGTTFTSEPWQYDVNGAPYGNVSAVYITDTHTYVTGSKEAVTTIAVFDPSGNLVAELGHNESGSQDLMGHITSMVETPNGFIAADSNLHRLEYWTPDYQFIGYIELDSILGTDGAYISDMSLAADGSVYANVVQMQQQPEKAKKDAEPQYELLVFKLTGF